MRRIAFVFVALVLIASCSKIGKYVYLSPSSNFRGTVVHVDRKCSKITVCQRMSIDEFKAKSKRNHYTYCNKCVDDDTYQEFMTLLGKNQ